MLYSCPLTTGKWCITSNVLNKQMEELEFSQFSAQLEDLLKGINKSNLQAEGRKMCDAWDEGSGRTHAER